MSDQALDLGDAVLSLDVPRAATCMQQVEIRKIEPVGTRDRHAQYMHIIA